VSQNRSGRRGKGEKSCPYRDSNADPSAVQPIASRYIDYAIPAPIGMLLSTRHNHKYSKYMLMRHRLLFTIYHTIHFYKISSFVVHCIVCTEKRKWDTCGEHVCVSSSAYFKRRTAGHVSMKFGMKIMQFETGNKNAGDVRTEIQ
jgi:hypothetical protein